MPVVGSSSSKRSASETSAAAKRTRWAWPPESFVVQRWARSLRPVSDEHVVDSKWVRVVGGHEREQFANTQAVGQRPDLEHAADPPRPHGCGWRTP